METPVAVTLEFTPNPNTLKFVVNRPLLDKGAANFTSADKTEHAPLAKRLFEVPGVQAVMIGTQFVTITKAPEGTWDVLAEEVPKALSAQLSSGTPVFDSGWIPDATGVTAGVEAEIENKIREVLDNEIRPAVAMDGGDITFSKYEDGIVYLQLQGACSACPSSIATLKMGVETRLRDAVPEIREVVSI